MKTKRFEKLPKILAGLYLILSSFIYFGTLGQPSHSWWPLLLTPLIFPFSLVVYLDTIKIFKIWYNHPTVLPDSAYAINDYLMGAYFIVIGTIWLWFVGKFLSSFISKRFPRS